MAYEIGEMTKDDARQAWEWAREEGWNPGIYDREIMPAIHPEGCFAGILGGEMISSITAVQYEKKYGFLGLYIVVPEYRGRGYGIKIWNHAIDHLINEAGVKCIGLDGVLSEEANYQKSGFHTAYRATRYKYTVDRSYPKIHNAIKETQLEAIVQYDQRISKVRRKSFLKDLVWNSEAVSYAACKDGEIIGYGIARPYIEGYRIGPLFADSLQIARELLESIFCDLRGHTVFIDVLGVNGDAMAMVKHYNMESSGFACIRMYTTGRYNQDVRYVFGNTTFEVG
jgi:GNAT superfamily N-acetyltransferase